MVPLTLLIVALFAPTIVFYVFRASSHAPGVVVAALAVVMLGILGVTKTLSSKEWLFSLAAMGAVGLLLLCHALIAALFEPVLFSRMALSLGPLALMLLGAVTLSRTLFDFSNTATSRALTVVVGLLMLIGVASLTGFQPPGAARHFKSIFPFTEPSHYALSVTPILLAFCVNHGLVVRSIALATALMIAYALQSLSLVVGVLIVAIVCLPTLWVAAGTALLAAAISVLDISYFADRLEFNRSSGNLSMLVYLQGWDLAGASMGRTHFWGVGFQQLGMGSIATYTSNLIVALAGNDLNVRDGGFTLAKLTAELGVFGIGIVAVYSAVLLRSAWILRGIAMRVRPANAGTVLALSFVCAYSIEVYVRGLGYFSGTTMLMLASILFLLRHRILSLRFRRSRLSGVRNAGVRPRLSDFMKTAMFPHRTAYSAIHLLESDFCNGPSSVNPV